VFHWWLPRRPKTRDAYTKAIALALVVLAVRPIIEPARVDAQGPKVRGQFGSEGNDAAFELLSRDADAGGVSGARSESAIQPPEQPNPF